MRLTPIVEEDKDLFFTSPMNHAVCSVAGCTLPAYRTGWPWGTKEIQINTTELNIQFQVSLCKNHWEYVWKEVVER